ncbi:uncharacterized protein LOC112896684 [Panicum hallii]|uniref:uncharacterized protein LOC112896684 n=1 Tax=Panicum hallii TaxID=206008 RepID=UPI000DF4E38E|nr:uncharacterized protein LOC112896684 [Panicum hallii]
MPGIGRPIRRTPLSTQMRCLARLSSPRVLPAPSLVPVSSSPTSAAPSQHRRGRLTHPGVILPNPGVSRGRGEQGRASQRHGRGGEAAQPTEELQAASIAGQQVDLDNFDEKEFPKAADLEFMDGILEEDELWSRSFVLLGCGFNFCNYL